MAKHHDPFQAELPDGPLQFVRPRRRILQRNGGEPGITRRVTLDQARKVVVRLPGDLQGRARVENPLHGADARQDGQIDPRRRHCLQPPIPGLSQIRQQMIEDGPRNVWDQTDPPLNVRRIVQDEVFFQRNASHRISLPLLDNLNLMLF